MALLDIVNETVQLAEARNAEQDELAQRFGVADAGLSVGSQAAHDYLNAPRPAAQALATFLRELDGDTAIRLLAIMYLGRGDSDDLVEIYGTWPGGSAGAVASIFEKAPLPEYLRRGAERAASSGFQLDAAWPPYVPPGPRILTGAQSVPPPQRAPASGFPIDPFKEGGRVFHELAARWPSNAISEPVEASAFLTDLMASTGGNVIVDFIDLRGWDRIDGFAMNPATGMLELYSRDYRHVDTTVGRAEAQRMMYPFSLYGLLIGLQEIRFVRGRELAVFLLAGHVLHRGEIKTHLSRDGSSSELLGENLFSSRALLRWGQQYHQFDVLHSPLYTVAVVPKGLRFSSALSRQLLLQANLDRVLHRLARVTSELGVATPAEIDLICEKANTARRCWEQALKIEIVYRGIVPKKGYGSLLIGDLVNELREFDTVGAGGSVTSVVRLANEFSHDAGRVIRLDEARTVAAHVREYVATLQKQIDSELHHE